MDPVAHTLFGAALAETGLKRLSRHATATLLIGANLPDVDVIAHLWGADASLYFRRGWSHGILALIVLPLLLAGGMWLWQRWRGKSAVEGPPFRLGVVLGLSFLAVWSHPLLDWLNTYGVRLLMPFDGRWFYGDTLFIVDPWVWLLTAAGVVLARSRSYPALAGWLLLGTLVTVLILATDRVPLTPKLIWLAGVAAIVLLRRRRPSQALRERVAQVSFATLVVYVCAVYGMARVAESLAAERFPGARQVQSNPAPALPHAHRIVVVHDDVYRVIAADGQVHELPRQQPDAIVRRALADGSIRGFVNWMRFPYWKVEETDSGWIVKLWDLRYQGPGGPPTGIGFAEVTVPKEPGGR